MPAQDSLLIIVNIHYPGSEGIVNMCEGRGGGSACTANVDRSTPMSVTEYRMPVCLCSLDIPAAFFSL